MNKFLLILFISLSFVSYAQQVDTTTTPASINNAETDTLNSNSTLPVFTTTSSDVSGGGGQALGANALLGASRDIFIQSNILHFMTARFLYRGYNTDNRTVMMNGVRLNSLQTGIASFSAFGGMTDVVRFMDQKTSLGSSRYTFGDIGGYFNLNVFASTFRKGLRVSYSQGNRIFKERVSLSYATGLNKKGWAFAISGNARYASQGYVPGTAFQSFGVFLGVDKKFNDRNTLSLVGFWAPITQALQSMETDEAFALTNKSQQNVSFGNEINNTLFNGNAGNNHYNSLWGFQNGQERSSRVRKTSMPTVILTDLWKIGARSTLTASIFGVKGRTSTTYLNYYGVPNPQPDYYKYMPSYFSPSSSDANPAMYAALTQAWQTGGVNPISGLATGQVDWDGMYRINRYNTHTVNNVDGIPGYTYTGKQSAYILEERRQDVTNAGYNAIFNTAFKDNSIHLTVGTNGTISNTRYYKVVNDLLGGDFWLDYNQFASSISPNPNTIQNNIKDPNKIIKQGDVFGYDYNINVMRFEDWAQIEKSFKNFDAYASVTLSNTSFYRAGNMVNGLFPTTSGVNGAPADGSSGGNSKTLDFFNYGFKAGITYKINGRNYITINGAYITKPPLPSNVFVSPRSRNDEIPGVGSEKILSGDITYTMRLPWLKGRITYYYTQVNNQTYLRSYFDDDYKTNINYFMKDLNQLNQGLELGLEGIVTKRVSIIGALGYGQYIYTNRPTATISADNTAALLASNRTVYLQNYHVGGTPQTAGSIGVRYNSKKYWYIGVYYNYFANNYVTINPDRRTQEALAKYVTTDPQVHQIADQEKLPDAYTVDLMAGKSFRFKGRYGLNLNLWISNLTNNMFKNYGSEQLRHDDNNIAKFPNKYAYTMGLTYQLSIAFTYY